MKMIIACDVDNVIATLQETVTKLFNKEYGTNYTLNDITEYNVSNVLPSKDAYNMKEMYAQKGIYTFVKPVDGAQKALQKLINAGHQVYLVTDAIPQMYNEKVKWINEFFPFIDNAHIVAMKHKHLFKADIMIEDNIENLLSGVHYHRICLDYPWNRAVQDYAYGICRCSNWNEIVDAVNKINEEE
jgi:5'(3')-deoxyribonucleotidase